MEDGSLPFKSFWDCFCGQNMFVKSFPPAPSAGLMPLVIVLPFIISVASIEANRQPTVRRNFATKSRYHFYDKDEVFNTSEKCKPLHLNMVLRHGTRHPSKKDIKGMERLTMLFQNDSPKTYGNLSLPWKNPFHNGDKMLTKTGEEEMYNISKRLLTRFPSLFNSGYNSSRHYFISTRTPRTSQSASALAFGLFEGKGHLGPSKFQPVSMTTTSLTDPVLRFFDTCPEYERKKHFTPETKHFKNGPEMAQVKHAIAERLGISVKILTTDHVKHMFLSCAYELAVYGSGQWCSVFEEDDLDVMEYFYDIKNYWKRGYGHKINYKISCLLLRNLTESIQHVSETLTTNPSASHTQAIFHFAHAETVIPLLCLMGLFNNTERLWANNFHSQKDRLFKTSNMAPFSGNVAVVLYSCEVESRNLDSQSFFVEVLVNEKPTALPCCGAKDLCPLQKFLDDCFGDVKRWCDLSKICHKHGEDDPQLDHNEL